MSATRDMLRAARRRVVEVAEECDPCRVLDAARAGHEGREGLREEELVDAREVAHERERRRVEPLMQHTCARRIVCRGLCWLVEARERRDALRRERGGVGFASCVVAT